MDRYLVQPGSELNLSNVSADDKELCPEGKEAGQALLEGVKQTLISLQIALFAEHKHRIMVVLQGMDTSGKDGTIRHVFGGLDPQGLRVATFGKPTKKEMEYDYLWRIHQEVPSDGLITIFNRSHYEDVLAVRVRKLKPESVWSKRYQHINDFERMLTDEGVTIIKIFLHIDQEEQKQRLISRKVTPHKQWKLIPEDIKDRKLWPAYEEAYNDTIARTSTDHAPWHVIPANRKWYRNLVIAQLMVEKLRALEPKFPEPVYNLSELHIE